MTGKLRFWNELYQQRKSPHLFEKTKDGNLKIAVLRRHRTNPPGMKSGCYSSVTAQNIIFNRPWKFLMNIFGDPRSAFSEVNVFIS